MTKRDFLRLPVVSASAEYLVMGYLMRRNILAYKAPPSNEGYDLICIHPDPRHTPSASQVPQVRVQVKSRYASDCDRGFRLIKTARGISLSCPEHATEDRHRQEAVECFRPSYVTTMLASKPGR
ncbi:MAG: hypothetical protein ACKOOI_15660 [Pirellula sp.]